MTSDEGARRLERMGTLLTAAAVVLVITILLLLLVDF